MRPRLVLVIVLAAVVGVGAWALVGHLLSSGRGGPGLLEAGALAAELELNAQQQERIAAINAEFQRQRDEVRARHREQRMELVRMLRATPPDREQIDAQLTEIGGLQARVQRLAVDHMLEVAAELDAGQRERLFELVEASMCPVAGMGLGGGCR